MKRTIIAITVALILSSCGKPLTDDKAGFEQVAEELKGKFGEGAYYTGITISYTKELGILFNVTTTNNPASLKMEEWNWVQNKWTQKAEVTLEITGGKPEDFMFQVDNKISIVKLGELIEQAKKQLKKEKDIDGVLSVSNINAPNDGDLSKLAYNITLEPKNGGTAYHFTYNLQGVLEEFNY
ncbi:hypothetical protein [Aquimarina litoralis]|uniref:hypothetical protein n=1 Tax=Aquimarina litoralis TaxID=584605 RepID=UPI001C59186D|nr:hypothetical protein [Aquimarina litoralis]MBW1297361.1 hypothetical protein [Aquimarina litoralis]